VLYDTVRRVYSNCLLFLFVEMCMEMGTNGIPCVPWESDGNHCHSHSHGNPMGMGVTMIIMGIGMGVGIKVWEWE